MNRKTIALSLLFFALAALPASAYERLDQCNGHWTRWPSPSKTLTLSYTDENQFASVEWKNSLLAAQAGWNQHAPGSNFRIFLQAEDPANPNDDPVGLLFDSRDDLVIWRGAWNYASEVKMQTEHQESHCSNFPPDVAHYTRVDLLVKPETNTYDKSTNPVPANEMTNTTLMLLHEFGHVMGLAHEDDVLATMNSSLIGLVGGPIGNNNDVQPLPDDVRGARAAYGTAATVRDVASSAVRRLAPGKAETIPAPGWTFRNMSLTFPFTILNRGTTNENILVHFYMSPTRYTHPQASYHLGSATISLLEGRSTTGSVTVHIPANAPSGYQYLGWYTDPYNSISIEASEFNNGVALVAPTYISDARAPNACFTTSQSSGNVPMHVTFDASCTTDPDSGDTFTYQWDFGDGTTATGKIVSHTYYYAGNYIAWLTVTDSYGAQTTTYQYITVTCNDPWLCPDDPT